MFTNKIKNSVLLFCFLIFTLMVAGCNGDSTEAQSSLLTSDMEEATEVSVDQLVPPAEGDEVLVLTTNMGVIKAKLFPKAVPETYENLKYHVMEGNYDGTIFHRVINDFMIQGGDIEHKDGTGGYSYKGPGTTIGEEFNPGLSHHRGALSMAKTMFPSTTGSQFFIVQKAEGTPHLDNQHSVFGQVFEGMEVVDAIANVNLGPMDKPVEDVVLEKVELETL